MANYIYLDDGRLENAAWIQGGVDEELRSRLSSPEGFRDIVLAIGFTIESENEELSIFSMEETVHPSPSSHIYTRLSL